MADGYARASGEPAAALVVPGAGLYNAASGLATAYSRATPALLVAGEIPRGHRQEHRSRARGRRPGRHGALRCQVAATGVQAREVPTPCSGRSGGCAPAVPPGADRDAARSRGGARGGRASEPARATRIVPSPEDLREAAQVIARSSMPREGFIQS